MLSLLLLAGIDSWFCNEFVMCAEWKLWWSWKFKRYRFKWSKFQKLAQFNICMTLQNSQTNPMSALSFRLKNICNEIFIPPQAQTTQRRASRENFIVGGKQRKLCFMSLGKFPVYESGNVCLCFTVSEGRAEGGPGISQHSVQYVNDSIFPLKVMNCLRAKLCFFPVEGEDNLNITKKKKKRGKLFHFDIMLLYCGGKRHFWNNWSKHPRLMVGLWERESRTSTSSPFDTAHGEIIKIQFSENNIFQST